MSKKAIIEKKAPPLAFLLECSDTEVGSFELARLGEVANLREQMTELFDRIVDVSSLAVLAGMLRNIDRRELKEQLLRSPEAKLEEIPAHANEEIRNQGHAEEESGPMPSPWGILPHMTPEEAKQARKASIQRWRESNIAKGKCEKCSQPQCRESVRLCERHLAQQRDKNTRYRRKNGVMPVGRGNHPRTLSALAASREKKSLAVLAAWGIKPKHPSTSLNAAREALLEHMPDKDHAMTQTELFDLAGVTCKTTGQRALKELLEAKRIQRIGKGSMRDLYRYFAACRERKSRALLAERAKDL